MHKILTYIHTALAAFFLPMGIMFAITGGLYAIGITGTYKTTEHSVALDAPLSGDLSAFVALAEQELDRLGLGTPTGKAGVKKGGTSYFFEWTGTRRDIEIHPTADPATALLKVKETGWHRFFVQLHKAKGGWGFRVFSTVWMVGLVGLFLTGGVMAFFAKKYRPVALVAGGLGIVVFVVLAVVS